MRNSLPLIRLLQIRLLRVLCFLGLAACALAAPPPRPNVILITMDTTRADRMGFLGSKLELTPTLDDLAKQGIVFSRAYSHVPLTTPSHATILSGTYPQFSHVSDFGVPIGKDLPYLPQILHDQGYQTAAIVSSVVLDPKAGAAPGFDRGFDIYEAGFRSRNQGEDRYQTVERRAGDVVERAIAWLNTKPAAPFFLWIHLYDPHMPYDPPEPFATRFASNPYDGEIAYMDSALATLFKELKARELFDGTLIAMTADHGEAFGEHGERAHGVFLYDETIHVPVLFKMPANQFSGARVESRARLVDILPTILDGVGIPVPQSVQGESLVPLMTLAGRPAGNKENPADIPPERVAYAETDYPYHAFGWSSLRALRSGKYLVVEAPRKELYDQSVDPHAEHNLAPESRAVTETLTSRLDTLRSKTSSAAESGGGKTDAALQKQLAALGYISTTQAVRVPGTETQGIDPKDKIAVTNLLEDALLAQQDGRSKQAIPMLEQVVAEEPNIEIAFRILGLAYMAEGGHENAVRALRKAVALRPDSVLDRYQLGMALFASGDLQGAKEQFETAFAKSPEKPDAHSLANLHFTVAAVYDHMGRGEDEVKELKAAIDLEPDDYDSNSTLGRVLLKQGNPPAALPYLQKALEIRPNLADAHFFLADAYAQLGMPGDSVRERLAGRSLQGFGK